MLLMFGVGLHFSIDDLLRARRILQAVLRENAAVDVFMASMNWPTRWLGACWT